MKFVEESNLPEKAKTIIIGEKYSQILDKPLENLGIEVIYVPDNPDVDGRLAGHADLSVAHLGEKKMALAPYLKGSGFADYFSELGCELLFPDMQQGEKYPRDAALNICLCGKCFFYNPKSAEKMIVDYLTIEKGKNGLSIKQGYSKCCICVVDENTIISSDQGIHERAVNTGYDSLLISPGHIELPGFNYGFIGGASFKLSSHELAFTGHLDMHPDKNIILNFLSLHNIKPVYITKKPVFDIGSCIQIVEK